MIAVGMKVPVEESPGSRKQGVQRKLERMCFGNEVNAGSGHRDYVDFSTLKVGRNE